jgi:hypothetical protein
MTRILILWQYLGGSEEQVDIVDEQDDDLVILGEGLALLCSCVPCVPHNDFMCIVFLQMGWITPRATLELSMEICPM